MRRLTIALAIDLIAVSFGCNGSEPATAFPGSTASAGSRQAAELIEPALIDACAGFTAQTAADILGISAAALDAETGRSEFAGGQLCRYWSPESLIGPGIQFVLGAEPSAAAAAASLRSLRESAPAGDAAIRSAVKQSASGPSLIDIEGVGDEAFWDALTNAVNVRVGNVVVSIQASSSKQLIPDKERAEVELERRVAEQVARGLRRSDAPGAK